MAVVRVHKSRDYTVMSNNHFRERGMTLKAKGLLSLMLSLPDDWDYSIAGLVTLSKDGKDSVTGALKELEEFGYLKRTQTIDRHGRFSGYDYDIFEKPIAENQNTGEPLAENPSTVNPPQLSNNKSITKQPITKKSSTDNKSNTTLPPKSKEVEDFFESVWALYPKKTNKAQIKKATKERLYKIGFEKISRCVERYKQELEYNGTDYQFIKAGSTFFNGGYEDYLADDWKLPERRFTPVSKQSGSSGNPFLDIARAEGIF